MKFAAIADVHGNCLALEAVLADMDAFGVNEIVNLGDHVSRPLEAARTADLLIERGFPSVRGDQDRGLLDLHQAGASTRGDFQQLERKHFAREGAASYHEDAARPAGGRAVHRLGIDVRRRPFSLREKVARSAG